jgi:predicted nucleic acid-binding Zn ribbon protein
MSYKMRPCPVCGGLMKAFSNRKTCSDRCKQKQYRLNKKARYGVVTKSSHNRPSARCANCGDVICNPRDNQKHCSPRCKQAMYRQNKRFGLTNPKPVQTAFPDSAYSNSNAQT